MVKLLVALFFVMALTLPLTIPTTVEGQGATEAPTGFDNLTNGFTIQGPPFDTIDEDNVVPLRSFNDNRFIFEESEEADDGLGPVFNARSCGVCHDHPVTGAVSQITELRAGHFNGSVFVDHPGDSLIGTRSTFTEILERILDGNEVRTFRTSLNTLGDGFVEAIANSTLTDIAAAQPGQSGGRIRGRAILVPVNEAGGDLRVGRFGWKNQHASLVSFAADAYKNEMGITSPLEPTENTSNGRFVGFGTPFDPVAEPEDDGIDVEAFAAFMRSTKAPPRDTALAATADAQLGSIVFSAIGCAICHVPAIRTAPPGTSINGGEFTVPPALGNKIIRPFGDFLLHDVGTGDGIVQNGGQATRNTVRTAPLWGVRTRNRLMHDGETHTFNDAILRHGGEATVVINNYRGLSTANKNRLIRFLESL
jgi:CxxC motif-containing protein (DUF1111 family)